MAVFIIGNYQSGYRESIELAIWRASINDQTEQVYFTPDVGVGRDLLTSHATGVVKCIFADVKAPGLDRFVTWVRGQVALFPVPVFGLLERITDSGFEEAQAIGLDDALCYTDTDGITGRLAALSRFDLSVRPPVTQGAAIIAHPDQGQRRVFARILRQAGFDPRFAANSDELIQSATSNPPHIIVAAFDLAQEDAVSSLRKVRELTAMAELPCVIVGAARQTEGQLVKPLELNAVELMAEKTPPDTLLFLTNELLRREALQGKPDAQRASPRVQYSALCAFRPSNDLVPVYGYTNNVSFEGVYIKTFNPPTASDDVRLEVRLAEQSTAVHLRGKLVWTRFPDSAKPAPVPPGFGFRIDPATCPPGDVAQYQAMYQRLLEAKQRAA
jgi:CheY-like chemotaxis protein